MKQTAQPSKTAIPLLAAVLTLLILFSGFITWEWLSSQKELKSQIAQNNESYGPLGYGRGQGGGQGAGQMNGQMSGKAGKYGYQQNQGLNKETCLMDGCLLAEDADFPVADLDEKTIEFLNLALADERKALATYQAAMTKFGSVKPFINIARAEEHHISMLLALFDKYGVAIPKDTTKVSSLPATLQEVCAIGVTAEIDNDALYQEMIPQIQQEDIKTVFTSLARASKEMHLPAFERCAK